MGKIRIRKLKNGKSTYVVDYRFGGQRKRLTFRTKGEAKEFISNVKHGRVGVVQNDKQVRLAETIRAYYETESIRKACVKLEKKWFEDFYNYMCEEENFSGFAIDAVEFVSEIAPLHLKQYRVTLQQTLKNATINRRFNTFNHFFHVCEDNSYLSKNPMKSLKRLPEKPEKKRLPKPEEFQKVLDEVSPQVCDFLFIQALTGARPIELRELRFSDIDFDKKIVILKSRKGDGTQRIREIPMPKALRDKFEKIKLDRRSQAKDFVFTGAYGDMGKSTVYLAVRRACKKLKIDPFTPYALRHLFCTESGLLGANIFDIQRLLGHSNINTTRNYYREDNGHLAKVMDLSAKRKLFEGRS